MPSLVAIGFGPIASNRAAGTWRSLIFWRFAIDLARATVPSAQPSYRSSVAQSAEASRLGIIITPGRRSTAAALRLDRSRDSRADARTVRTVFCNLDCYEINLRALSSRAPRLAWPWHAPIAHKFITLLTSCYQHRKSWAASRAEIVRSRKIVLIQGRYGGWGGIRTPETLAGLPVFKTGAFNHSATHPVSKHLVKALDGANPDWLHWPAEFPTHIRGGLVAHSRVPLQQPNRSS